MFLEIYIKYVRIIKFYIWEKNPTFDENHILKLSAFLSLAFPNIGCWFKVIHTSFLLTTSIKLPSHYKIYQSLYYSIHVKMNIFQPDQIMPLHTQNWCFSHKCKEASLRGIPYLNHLFCMQELSDLQRLASITVLYVQRFRESPLSSERLQLKKVVLDFRYIFITLITILFRIYPINLCPCWINCDSLVFLCATIQKVGFHSLHMLFVRHCSCSFYIFL